MVTLLSLRHFLIPSRSLRRSENDDAKSVILGYVLIFPLVHMFSFSWHVSPLVGFWQRGPYLIRLYPIYFIVIALGISNLIKSHRNGITTMPLRLIGIFLLATTILAGMKGTLSILDPVDTGRGRASGTNYWWLGAMITMNYRNSPALCKALLAELPHHYNAQESNDIKMGFAEWFAGYGRDDYIRAKDAESMQQQIRALTSALPHFTPDQNHDEMIRALGVYAAFWLCENQPAMLKEVINAFSRRDQELCGEGIGYMAMWKLKTAPKFIDFTNHFSEHQKMSIYQGYGIFLTKNSYGHQNILTEILSARPEAVGAVNEGLRIQYAPCLKYTQIFFEP